MKTLIINGSPRIQGDTAALIAELRLGLTGEVTELSAFRANIAPCVDCRACWLKHGCVVHDDMRVVYADDYDAIVLASPVYFGTLPGPVLSLMSRFQIHFGAEYHLKEPIQPRPKKAGLILTAGGKGNEASALRPARVMFRLTNATGFEEHTVLSVNTDKLPAAQDAQALAAVRSLAAWLEE